MRFDEINSFDLESFDDDAFELSDDDYPEETPLGLEYDGYFDDDPNPYEGTYSED